MEPDELSQAFEDLKAGRLHLPLYYIREPDGRVVMCEDVITWGKWFETREDRIIEKTYLEGDVRISTVFLGLDHGLRLDPDVAPTLWETMVFGGLLDREMYRYTSEEEARIGHYEITLEVQDLLVWDAKRWACAEGSCNHGGLPTIRYPDVP